MLQRWNKDRKRADQVEMLSILERDINVAGPF